jgi:signal transduction histidine kinase/ligand-binding sensor domain-containing protein
MPIFLTRLIVAVLSLVVFQVGLGRALATTESSGWSYRAWQTDEGLPDNNVSGVAQTPDGFLWVATFGGLVRFDGARFDEFLPVNLPGVPNRFIRALLCDKRGRLWLGMDRGVVICAEPNRAQVFTVSNGLPDLRISSMAEDADGAIWIAYVTGGFSQIKDGTVMPFGFDSRMSAGASSWVVADAKGQLWFSMGTDVGVFRDGQLKKLLALDEPLTRIAAARDGGIWICNGRRLLKFTEGRAVEERGRVPINRGNTEPRILFEDHSGAVWIGTLADGLFRYAGSEITPVETSHREITALMEDTEGNIWAGTGGGGFDRLRPRELELLGRESGSFESVRSVCQDTAGIFWVVTQDGMLLRQNGKGWLAISTGTNWPGGHASCVAADGQNSVWIGTRDKGLFHFQTNVFQVWQPPDGLAGWSVHSLLVSSNSGLWIGINSPNVVQEFHDGTFRTFSAPPDTRALRAMTEDATGTLWLGSADGQLLRVSGDRLVGESTVKESRPMSIRRLYATPDGSLWIGYAGYGLGRLKSGHYSRITTEQGLNDDYISQMVADDQGWLWFGSNRGIFQVRQSDLVDCLEGQIEHVRSIAYGKGEGLPSLQASFEGFPGAIRSRGGQLLIPMRTGLAIVHPENIHVTATPPPVALERVKVDDRTVALYDSRSPLQSHPSKNWLNLRNPGGVLALPPTHRKIEFEFAALSFTAVENARFRYRLEGYDDGWVEVGTERNASYPHLPAGNYHFQVAAGNNLGVWSETGVALTLEVSPFFWQTWWFRGLALITFAAGVTAVVRYVSFRRLRVRMQLLEQQAALEKERARIARDMHDEVGAKLTRLSLLSEMAAGHAGLPSSASGEVKEISETARETIRSFEEIVWAVNPRNDTLADLVHYLCRYAEDYFDGSPVQCAFDLGTEIPHVMLPTEVRHHVFLAAKEALSNVLKHANASRVRLQLALAPDEFKISIEDDGCGFDIAAPPKRASGGNGLENMRERLHSIGGRLECHSQPNQGTRIVFNAHANFPTVG